MQTQHEDMGNRQLQIKLKETNSPIGNGICVLVAGGWSSSGPWSNPLRVVLYVNQIQKQVDTKNMAFKLSKSYSKSGVWEEKWIDKTPRTLGTPQGEPNAVKDNKKRKNRKCGFIAFIRILRNVSVCQKNDENNA